MKILKFNSATLNLDALKERITEKIETNVVDLSQNTKCLQPIDLIWKIKQFELCLQCKVHFEKEYDQEEDGREGERPVNEYIITAQFDLANPEVNTSLTLWTKDGDPIFIENEIDCLNIIEGIINNTKL